uniref:DUF2062 domain-containing protein n=1 Tax=Candidatus Electronema sp. TaxID=2698783 RepID=UPI0040560295
ENLLRKASRLPRYYFLRIKRLKGDPEYLARGFAFGIFMGILPLAPVQTLILIPLTILFRVSTLAAFIAGIMVSNPLTFIPQYYFSWKIGDAVLPGWVTWAQIENALHVIAERGLLDGLAALSQLGFKAIAVIETGGAIIGIPAGIISYFFARRFFLAVSERRLKKRRLDFIPGFKHD